MRRPSVRQQFQTTSPLKPCSRFLQNFTYSIYRPEEWIISCCFFCLFVFVVFFLFQSDKNFGVAMAIYNCHYLKWEKIELAFIAISLQIFWRIFYRNVPWEFLYRPYEFCPNRWIWLVAMATERLNLRKKYSKIIFSEAIRGMKLKLCRNVHNISLYKSYVFFFFVAVAHVLSSLWQLKVPIDL